VKGTHQILDCPKYLKDHEGAKVSIGAGGKYIDKRGQPVQRTDDGWRRQLYRQNQEEISE
jgi:hypothetical protein